MNAQPTKEILATKKTISKGWIVLVAVVISGAILWTAIKTSDANEPAYGGKKLSQWLVEVDYGQREAVRKVARDAIAQIGTNALPLILKYLHTPGSRLPNDFNALLAKIPQVKFRFVTADDRLRRAIWGIDALGPLAAPAIPELRGMLQSCPGYVPEALAGIGPEAVPSLQECLTNNSAFYFAGNTIGAIHNAINRGRIPASYAQVFLPEIQRLAASTNAHAKWYATNFLSAFPQGTVSPRIIVLPSNGSP
jgi:hypothetical protein